MGVNPRSTSGLACQVRPLEVMVIRGCSLDAAIADAELEWYDDGILEVLPVRWQEVVEVVPAMLIAVTFPKEEVYTSQAQQVIVERGLEQANITELMAVAREHPKLQEGNCIIATGTESDGRCPFLDVNGENQRGISLDGREMPWPPGTIFLAVEPRIG